MQTTDTTVTDVPFKPSQGFSEPDGDGVLTPIAKDHSAVAVDLASGADSTSAVTLIKLPRIPTAAELLPAANMALATMKLTTIGSLVEFEGVAEDLRGIKTAQAGLEEQRTAITGPMNGKLKEVNDVFRPAREAYEEAEALGKKLMLGYQREQDRLAAIAREKARLAAAAELARMAKEAAEAKAISDAEEKRLNDIAKAAEREAAAAIAAGNAQAAADAQAVADAAAAAAVDVKQEAAVTSQVQQQTSQAVASSALHMVTPVTATAKGTSRRSKWSAAVTDKASALAHIAADPTLHNLIDFNMSALNKLVDAQREGFRMPGIEPVQEFQLGVRKA